MPTPSDLFPQMCSSCVYISIDHPDYCELKHARTQPMFRQVEHKCPDFKDYFDIG